MRAYMAHIRTFFNLVDLALSDTKKECYDVASVLKQVSGGVLMWALVIRLGQDLILQANGYCISNSVYGVEAIPLFQGGYFALLQAVPTLKRGFRFSPCRTPTANGSAEGADRQKRIPGRISYISQ